MANISNQHKGIKIHLIKDAHQAAEFARRFEFNKCRSALRQPTSPSLRI